MITYIGFDHKPLAYVIWGNEKEDKFKTVCYTPQEINETLQLKYGDLEARVIYVIEEEMESVEQ